MAADPVGASPSARPRLPPGPRAPGIVQTLAAVLRPMEFAERCRDRFGDVVRIRFLPVGDVVCVTSAELVTELIHGDPEVFHAGDVNGAMDFIVGARSILLLEGAEHSRRRRALLAPFTERTVHRYRETVDAIVAERVRAWPLGTPTKLVDLMQDVTLDVIMRIVFGITDSERLARLRVLLPQLLHVNPLLFAVRFLRRDLGPGSPGRRLRRAEREVDDILVEEIRRRRDGRGDDRDDVLSALLAARDDAGGELSEVELRDNLVTLLVVGHETTAATLAWAFERLVRHPDDLERLTAEVAGGDGDFLEAVINETLRVRPVIPDVARTVRVATRVGGYDVPAGTMVALSLSQVAAGRGACPAAADYRPERFLDDSAPSTFLPFGAGAHRCLGASFAMMTMRSVLTVVLAEFEIEPADRQAERPRATGPLVVPSRGARAVVRRRTRAPSGA